MKLIEQSHETLYIDDLTRIEIAGRTCYKSEDKITDTSADAFVRMLIKRGHEAMLEHGSATVKFITNRGVTHELVRHRVASFGQESTRYVGYTGITEFIKPVWFSSSATEDWIGWDLTDAEFDQGYPEHAVEQFIVSLAESDYRYKQLLEAGWRPEQAREVLPNALKTEIVATANFREFRHIFKLRALGTTGKPHPQMQALMLPVLKEFAKLRPAMFDDLYQEAVTKGLYK